MSRYSFSLIQTRDLARAGILTTANGSVTTPMFMPVGTAASVKSLDTNDLSTLGAQIILANTYHLSLRPGDERVARLGGVGKMMHWKGPLLTDSGGFQVFSLGKQLAQKQSTRMSLRPARIREDGVEFTSHLDGSVHFLGPQQSIAIQRNLGADIIMAFDECTPDAASAAYAREALDRTHRWSRESLYWWNKTERASAQGWYQALFGIVQGGMHKDLRLESARTIASMGFDGIAIGGETIGYNMAGTARVMEWIESELPKNQPRYAMGLGSNPQDILDAVMMGFDMFDCVAPTRLARNGALYTGQLTKSMGRWIIESDAPTHRIRIGAAQYCEDTRTILQDCDCMTCTTGITRAYLHHLFRAKELSYYRFASIHNLRFMIRLMEDVRRDILASR